MSTSASVCCASLGSCAGRTIVNPSASFAGRVVAVATAVVAGTVVFDEAGARVVVGAPDALTLPLHG